ncbi:Golgi membrane protein 1-like [Hylaeus anthracinus]|uniref:Golgi membrane protein 1-like n=1 Tax=Hylaeus anthracinus TaxID=313031 RepID=UPI0023B8BD44|nr:Golgi membrane protein 1-like [Hylaeus anthracinus]
MGIDSMRVGGGRCPPLLVGGLLVACLMLICNWWTLSSENIELVRQIDELNEQLKISAEERDQCVTLRGNLEQRYKHAEEEIASLHVRLEQQADLKKKNEELEDSVSICKSELDSLNKLDATKTATLETLRLEKNTLNTQIDVKQDENKKLQEEVDELKDELDKLKLTCNKTPERKLNVLQQSTRTLINKTQLGPLPETAVKVSVAGQRGLKYHGIPVLPTDPPGAMRLSPRLSVAMLKSSNTFLLPQAQATPRQRNNTSNDGKDDSLNTEGVDNIENNKQGNAGSTDSNVAESERDQEMKAGTGD